MFVLVISFCIFITYFGVSISNLAINRSTIRISMQSQRKAIADEIRSSYAWQFTEMANGFQMTGSKKLIVFLSL